jgi:predicted TIM-barrel fold metal-dependent hydrolase
MPVDEYLISVDGHAQVSHDAVKANLATKFHPAYDEALGAFGKRMMERMTANNNAAWAQKSDRAIKESSNSFRLRNMQREGHKEPLARLKDMDEDGVAAEIIYCEVSGFRYLYDLREGAYEATMAFNDAMHQFGEPDRSRLIMNYQIPLHDIDNAIKEVQRVAAFGGKSLQLPVFPPEVGLPDYYHERYDPLLAAIQETGLPIACHIGLNTMMEDVARRDPTPGGVGHMPLIAMSTAEALGMWIMAGVLERFPDLKLVFVEPGLGWIAWWIYIADDFVVRQGYETPHIKEKPSYYWHRNVHATFIDEPDAIQAEEIRYRLGVENIMWSSDYPHPVTSWPNSHKIVDEVFQGVPQTERELMVSGNAKRVWNL